jgi:hypothetical protein
MFYVDIFHMTNYREDFSKNTVYVQNFRSLFSIVDDKVIARFDVRPERFAKSGPGPFSYPEEAVPQRQPV